MILLDFRRYIEGMPRIDLYKKRTVYVYKITNKINGKLYIGVAGSLEKRWAEHKSAASTKRKSVCFYLQRAISKYGADNFTFEEIERCDCYFMAFERETYWIKYYNSRNNKIGYNLTLGGEGGSAGESSTSAKLKENQVLEILIKFATGNFTYVQLGKEYCVDSTTIGYIIRFKNWPEMKDKISDELKNNILIARKNNKQKSRWTEENSPNLGKTGRDTTGSCGTKINEKQVLEIRSLYETGKYSMKELGKMYGVYDSHICRIVHKQIWAYV
jgi:group I intron endonuclease